MGGREGRDPSTSCTVGMKDAEADRAELEGSSEPQEDGVLAQGPSATS